MSYKNFTLEKNNPLKTLLNDLELYGVTDIVNEELFNFTTGKIVSPFIEQTVEKPKKSVEKTLSTYSKPKQKPKEQTKTKRSINDIAWKFGSKSPKIQVVISSSETYGTHPLSLNAKALFVKMLLAINIKEEDVQYLVLLNADELNQNEKNLAIDFLNANGEYYKLFIGEDVTKLILGNSILKLRNNENKFADKYCGLIIHPESLLAQPLLKKVAWQELLKFKLRIK